MLLQHDPDGPKISTPCNAINRLSQRIDALASRRRGLFTLESLTDEALAKLRLLAPDYAGLRTPTGCEHVTDELIRFLVESGVLTAADFKGNTNGHANGD
jgi:hypothetical protein